ncbi:MAG: hypothetical protein KME04_19090 [Pleurocapsa minor GSE-CHR-MK-17-07R]|nr:hypothetical protein [Pleurocapsa minor GSE-CHR-MK 17-07R]
MNFSFKELLYSRVHRILKPIDSVRLGSAPDWIELFNFYADVIKGEEEIIAVYDNQQDVRSNLIFTTEGLHFYSERWIFIDYADMESVHVDANDASSKTKADTVILAVRDIRFRVQVLGGEGQFRDVYEISRFLSRVSSDKRRYAGGQRANEAEKKS